MNMGIGWHFPPTGGGRSDGFNDPGIAHFSGAPLASLTREAIQNSLDAVGRIGEPVHVDFELIQVSTPEIGSSELADALKACKAVPENEERVVSALDTATRLLDKPTIPFLRISDRNTTGLQGERWRTLVKAQGVSYKPDMPGAGGSHGIGKYAPFAVSSLRTVFYWTCYHEDGRNVERFQGKCVLMSHQSSQGETQGTGFFGIKDGCKELTDQEVPRPFRILQSSGQPVLGTSLAIAGFRESQNWRLRIGASVLQNFFFAIANDQLTVNIEPSGQDDIINLDKASLGAWFESLLNEGVDDDLGDESSSGLAQARAFWDLTQDSPHAEKQDTDLGHCQLWIRVAEDMPSKVAFIRRTGMLVTSQQKGMMRFPGYQGFAAVCLFSDTQGNELLRRMENAEHNQFEPDRLPESERERGRRALKRITDWIRTEVRKVAGPPEGGTSNVLSGLATYLPDYYPDEPFDDVAGDERHGEPGFAQRITLALKPIRRATPPKLDDEEPDDEGDDTGEDTGSSGGGGTGTNGGEGGNGGSGEGEGMGGTDEGGGGGTKAKNIPISSVRVLPIDESRNQYKLSFVPSESGLARLELSEAGDSSTIKRNDVRVVTDGVSLERVRLVRGQEMDIEITADNPIGGRAWKLNATTPEKSS